METAVAVVVHDRDSARAVGIARDAKGLLDREADQPADGALTDEELLHCR